MRQSMDKENLKAVNGHNQLTYMKLRVYGLEQEEGKGIVVE